jgi:hypothetical protein
MPSETGHDETGSLRPALSTDPPAAPGPPAQGEQVGLGDEFEVTICGTAQDGLWPVHPPLLGGWSWLVRGKHPTAFNDDMPYEQGETLSAWIVAVNPGSRTVLLSGTDYGRLPVARKLRPRYVRALVDVGSMLEAGSKGRLLPPAPENLSEFKGLLGRSVRGDQPDWYTVYRALQLESRWTARRLYDHTVDLQRALKECRSDGALSLIRVLNAHGLAAMVAAAERILRAEEPILERVTALRTHVPCSNAQHREEDRESEEAPYITSLVARCKLDRANALHIEVVESVARELSRNGYTPQSNELIDLFCQREHDAVIFEIKSITERNWLDQIRKAVSQLYEYRFVHGLNGAHLCIVLSQQPYQEWVLEYLERDRSISVCWLDRQRGGFAGPGARCLGKA